MTWFDSNYTYRQIVGVDVFGGSGVSATIDIETLVPADWDTFWTTIRSDFYDVVVTNAKGVVLNYSRSGANYANRALTLQVDGLTIDNDDSMNAIYIYFGYADETTDRSVATTITSPKTGHILLENPYGRIVPAQSAIVGIDSPLASFSKSVNEDIDIFFSTSNMFGKRVDTYNQRLDFEGIKHVVIKSFDSSGTNDDTRISEPFTRLGNNFVRARFKGGTDETSYAATIQITTTEGQFIESRCILRTKDLLPE